LIFYGYKLKKAHDIVYVLVHMPNIPERVTHYVEKTTEQGNFNGSDKINFIDMYCNSGTTKFNLKILSHIVN